MIMKLFENFRGSNKLNHQIR